MKVILIIIGIITLFGCNKDKNEVVFLSDIEKINGELKDKIHFDISYIKEHTDSVYKLDDQFYLDLLEQIKGGLDKSCFKRANISRYPVDLSGNKFDDTNSIDSISKVMMHCFANNMNMSDCKDSSKDSLCQFKTRLYNIMSGKEEAQMSYSFHLPVFDILDLENQASKDEFHYLILYFHYLGEFIDVTFKK
jgi:hypothetical protein